ncbi:MAG TPA: hypothetical protein VGK46_13330 [Saprospiraceae bacterium]
MSCHKDSDVIVNQEEYPDPPVVLVSAKLVSLADTTYSGFQNGIQTFSDQMVSFDQLPFQQIHDTGIDRDFELVSFTTAEGYPLYKVQNLVENDINYLHWIQPLVTLFTGMSNEAASYSISPNATLDIPANALKDISGQLYEGPYKVYVSVMHPDDQSALAIPSYSGIKKDGEPVSLLFSDCYYINVMTPDKGQLHFENDAVISNTNHSGAMWYFDAERSTWIIHHEGEHEISVPVEKPGYYAIADASRLIRVEGVLTINGKTAPHYPIDISYAGQVRKVYTTNLGKWALQVPSEINVKALVNLPCDQVTEISLLTSKDPLQTFPINVQAGEITNVHITGTARDCFGDLLVNHVILVSSGNYQFLFQDQAELETNLIACTGQMIGVRTLNLETNEYGPEVFWPVAPDIDVSTSFGCTMANEEYVMIKIDGDRKLYWDFKSSVTPQDRLLIETGSEEVELDLRLYISGMAAGDYEDTELNIEFEDQTLGSKGYALYCPTSTIGCGFTSFKITHFPDQTGEWIRGRFKGNFWMKTFHPLTAGYRAMEGEFQVYRDF